MDEEIPYIYEPDYTPITPDVETQDENNVPTLKRVLATIDEEIDKAQNIDSLNVNEASVGLTVKQQLAVNQRLVDVLREVRSTIETTIINIDEKYKG